MSNSEVIKEAKKWLASKYPTHRSELEADYEAGVLNVANLISALTASEAENARLRKILASIEIGLTCRSDSGHYCPDCDNNLWAELDLSRQALTGEQS